MMGKILQFPEFPESIYPVVPQWEIDELFAPEAVEPDRPPPGKHRRAEAGDGPTVLRRGKAGA